MLAAIIILILQGVFKLTVAKALKNVDCIALQSLYEIHKQTKEQYLHRATQF